MSHHTTLIRTSAHRCMVRFTVARMVASIQRPDGMHATITTWYEL
jgi:hypothetical protein